MKAVAFMMISFIIQELIKGTQLPHILLFHTVCNSTHSHA